jgi:hypothetical protein
MYVLAGRSAAATPSPPPFYFLDYWRPARRNPLHSARGGMCPATFSPQLIAPVL